MCIVYRFIDIDFHIDELYLEGGHLLPAELGEARLVGVEALLALGEAGLGAPVPDLGVAPPALVRLVQANLCSLGSELGAVGGALHPGLQIVPAVATQLDMVQCLSPPTFTSILEIQTEKLKRYTSHN